MKGITEIDFKQILKESIDELRRLGAAATPAANGSAGTQQADNPNAKSPTARAAFYETDANGNESLTVRLQWIHNQHAGLIDQWNQKYGQILTASRNMMEKTSPDEPAPIDIKVVPGQEEAFEQIIPSLVSDIASMNGIKGGFYKQNALQKLESSIKGRINEAPTAEDWKKAEERQATNVESILGKLSDPNFVKSLGFVGGTTINMSTSINNAKSILKQGNSCGWRISPLNQIMVKSYLPNATFVTNEWTWNNVFNRDVVDKSMFAFEVKVVNNKPKDVNAWNQACAQLGYQDPNNSGLQPYDVFRNLKKSGQLSQAQIAAVAFRANIINPHSADFYHQKVYDISNTQLRQGMPDVFNDEVNYADNIQGIPNAKAIEGDKQIAADAGAEYKPQEVVPKTQDEVSDIINILSSLCMRDCGTAPRSAGGTMGDDIAHFAYFYAYNCICRSRNIVKDSMKEAASCAFAIGVAAVYGYPVQKYSGKLTAALNNSRGDTSFRQNITALYSDFASLVSEINLELLKLSNGRVKSRKNNAKVVAESMDMNNMPKPLSFQEFAKLLGVNEIDEEFEETINDVEEPESIQESFYTMLDKMEHING